MTRTVRDATVLIAGAAGGLGPLFAARAAAEGARYVILWDPDRRALADLDARLVRLARRPTRIVSSVVDLGEAGAIAQSAQLVRREFGGVDVLVTGGAPGRSADFWELDSGEDIRGAVRRGALAPMYAAREFLPGMITGGRSATNNRAPRAARIVTVVPAAAGARSAGGILAAAFAHPGASVPLAAGAAVAAWSMSLRGELLRAGHRHVRVTTAAVPAALAAASGAAFPGEDGASPRAAFHVERIWRAMLEGRPTPAGAGWGGGLSGLVARARTRVAEGGAADAVMQAASALASVSSRNRGIPAATVAADDPDAVAAGEPTDDGAVRAPDREN